MVISRDTQHQCFVWQCRGSIWERNWGCSVPLRMSVLQDLIRNEDRESQTSRWEGRKTSLWDELNHGQPWDAAQLDIQLSIPGCSSSLGHSPCAAKSCMSSVVGRVPAQQQAGISDGTTLSFFLVAHQDTGLFESMDLSCTVQNHHPAHVGPGCKSCSGETSLFWCSWQSLGWVLALGPPLHSPLV